jgi:SM-20-related protein
MSVIDLDALRATPRKSDPYDYLVVPNFVPSDGLAKVIADFPTVKSTGSLPLTELDIHGAFKTLIERMEGPEFRDLIASKFGVDLEARPTMFTVRGRCHAADGKIHTDTGTKIITVLLYLNQAWEADGGRLRILRSPTLDDAADEVSPTGGTLLVFRRSEKSWHGHQPFEGSRRVIQMNWVTDQRVVAYEQRRHRVSAFFKRLNPFRGAA